MELNLESTINNLKINKIDLLDTSFLIFVRIDSDSRKENLYIVAKYLATNFKTNIILREVDHTPKLEIKKLPTCVQYTFSFDDSIRLHHTKHINLMIRDVQTPYISIYDTDAIISPKQIFNSIDILRKNQVSAVSPYNGNFLNVDPIMKRLFQKIQDINFLQENQNKLKSSSKRSFGGAIFLNKDHYNQAGNENENLIFWGPNDIERIKRLTVLGHKVERIEGNLYHLHHSRGINSGYQSLAEQEALIGEYLKICNFNGNQLREYINTWSWK